jgi:LPXTG-motif cell wall-anchored protein
VIVLHNKDTGKWEVIDSDKVKVNDDGSVSVEFTSFSPIAFLSVVDDATADDNKTDDTTTTPADTSKPADTTKPAATTSNKVTSPQTGETANGYVVVASLMLLAAAAYCMTRAKRTEC